MSRRTALIALLLGLVLVAGSAAVLVTSGDGDAGDVSVIEGEVRAAIAESDQPSSAPILVSTTSPNSVTPDPDGADETTERGGDRGEPGIRREYQPPDLVVEPGPVPVGLRIDGLEVDSPVGSYGVNRRTGEMDVPDNVTDVGWYQYGASPGERGSSVLAAHVDLASQGPGVFFNLRKLDPGMLVVVEMDDGTERYFRVQARKTYDKDELPLDVIFAKDGPPILTLITCGGGFNENIGSYDSNVVVYAVPVDGPTDGFIPT